MTEEKEKHYTNGTITVIWQPALCTHSTHCWKGMVQVFNPRNRPWVNLEGAATEDIIRQVDQCPSGALSWLRNSELPAAEDQQNGENSTTPVEIIVTRNGSLKVVGKTVVKDEDGKVLIEGEKLFLCRCGQSAKKPFCDGSHKRVGFTG